MPNLAQTDHKTKKKMFSQWLPFYKFFEHEILIHLVTIKRLEIDASRVDNVKDIYLINNWLFMFFTNISNSIHTLFRWYNHKKNISFGLKKILNIHV